MATCTNCGDYYRLTPYNPTDKCDCCIADSLEDDFYEDIDPATEIDIRNLRSPSGKVQPSFNEVDLEDDSHGF